MCVPLRYCIIRPKVCHLCRHTYISVLLLLYGYVDKWGKNISLFIYTQLNAVVQNSFENIHIVFVAMQSIFKFKCMDIVFSLMTSLYHLTTSPIFDTFDKALPAAIWSSNINYFRLLVQAVKSTSC